MKEILPLALGFVARTVPAEQAEQVQRLLRDRAEQKTLDYGGPLVAFNGRETLPHLRVKMVDALMFAVKAHAETSPGFEALRMEALIHHLASALAVLTPEDCDP